MARMALSTPKVAPRFMKNVSASVVVPSAMPSSPPEATLKHDTSSMQLAQSGEVGTSMNQSCWRVLIGEVYRLQRSISCTAFQSRRSRPERLFIPYDSQHR